MELFHSLPYTFLGMEKNPSAFQENKIVLVSGRISDRGDTPKLIAEDVEELVEKG